MPPEIPGEEESAETTLPEEQAEADEYGEDEEGEATVTWRDRLYPLHKFAAFLSKAEPREDVSDREYIARTFGPILFFLFATVGFAYYMYASWIEIELIVYGTPIETTTSEALLGTGPAPPASANASSNPTTPTTPTTDGGTGPGQPQGQGQPQGSGPEAPPLWDVKTDRPEMKITPETVIMAFRSYDEEPTIKHIAFSPIDADVAFAGFSDDGNHYQNPAIRGSLGNCPELPRSGTGGKLVLIQAGDLCRAQIILNPKDFPEEGRTEKRSLSALGFAVRYFNTTSERNPRPGQVRTITHYLNVPVHIYTPKADFSEIPEEAWIDHGATLGKDGPRRIKPKSGERDLGKNAKGERLQTGKDGKLKIGDKQTNLRVEQTGDPDNPLALVDKDGNRIRTQNGEEVYVDPETGEAYIVDRNGKRHKVKIGKDGLPETDNAGRTILTDEEGDYILTEDGKKHRVETLENGQKLFTDEKGQKYVLDKDGNARRVMQNEDGTLSAVDENGEKIRTADGREVLVDENGNTYILDKNGNKVMVEIGEDGQVRVLTADGKKLLIGIDGRLYELDRYGQRIYHDGEGLRYIENMNAERVHLIEGAGYPGKHQVRIETAAGPGWGSTDCEGQDLHQDPESGRFYTESAAGRPVYLSGTGARHSGENGEERSDAQGRIATGEPLRTRESPESPEVFFRGDCLRFVKPDTIANGAGDRFRDEHWRIYRIGPDGRRIYLRPDGTWYIFDPETGEEIRTDSQGRVVHTDEEGNAYVLDEDGNRIYTRKDGSHYIVDGNGREIETDENGNPTHGGDGLGGGPGQNPELAEQLSTSPLAAGWLTIPERGGEAALHIYGRNRRLKEAQIQDQDIEVQHATHDTGCNEPKDNKLARSDQGLKCKITLRWKHPEKESLETSLGGNHELIVKAEKVSRVRRGGRIEYERSPETLTIPVRTGDPDGIAFGPALQFPAFPAGSRVQGIIQVRAGSQAKGRTAKISAQGKESHIRVQTTPVRDEECQVPCDVLVQARVGRRARQSRIPGQYRTVATLRAVLTKTAPQTTAESPVKLSIAAPRPEKNGGSSGSRLALPVLSGYQPGTIENHPRDIAAAKRRRDKRQAEKAALKDPDSVAKAPKRKLPKNYRRLREQRSRENAPGQGTQGGQGGQGGQGVQGGNPAQALDSINLSGGIIAPPGEPGDEGPEGPVRIGPPMDLSDTVLPYEPIPVRLRHEARVGSNGNREPVPVSAVVVQNIYPGHQADPRTGEMPSPKYKQAVIPMGSILHGHAYPLEGVGSYQSSRVNIVWDEGFTPSQRGIPASHFRSYGKDMRSGVPGYAHSYPLRKAWDYAKRVLGITARAGAAYGVEKIQHKLQIQRIEASARTLRDLSSVLAGQGGGNTITTGGTGGAQQGGGSQQQSPFATAVTQLHNDLRNLTIELTRPTAPPREVIVPAGTQFIVRSERGIIRGIPLAEYLKDAEEPGDQASLDPGQTGRPNVDGQSGVGGLDGEEDVENLEEEEDEETPAQLLPAHRRNSTVPALSRLEQSRLRQEIEQNNIQETPEGPLDDFIETVEDFDQTLPGTGSPSNPSTTAPRESAQNPEEPQEPWIPRERPQGSSQGGIENRLGPAPVPSGAQSDPGLAPTEPESP